MARGELEDVDLLRRRVDPDDRVETAVGDPGTTVRRDKAALDSAIDRCFDAFPRLAERRFALEPVAELDPLLLPWRNCSDLRVDVSVADLLPTVANQEVMRVGGPDWADPVSPSSRS